MKTIFLDTEFASATQELAQLSYILLDGTRRVCRNFYFRVSAMDEGSFRVCGLSKEFLDENGVAPEEAKQEIFEDFSGAALVAHNLNSDKKVLKNAFGELPNKCGLCTMYRFARVLRLSGGTGKWKMPSLRELMAHYGITEAQTAVQALTDFGTEAAAHDARFDAEAVCLCALAAMANGDCYDLLNEKEKTK